MRTTDPRPRGRHVQDAAPARAARGTHSASGGPSAGIWRGTSAGRRGPGASVWKTGLGTAQPAADGRQDTAPGRLPSSHPAVSETGRNEGEAAVEWLGAALAPGTRWTRPGRRGRHRAHFGNKRHRTFSRKGRSPAVRRSGRHAGTGRVAGAAGAREAAGSGQNCSRTLPR